MCGRGRTEARCRPFGRSVSSVRPPNRTCESSPHPALHKLMSLDVRPILLPTA
jgi:hypothetical protein